MRMERVNQILQHTLYQSCRRQIDEKEKDRIFCGHDMGHLLDVARLAWIFNLEANQEISKERIYAAALLHDIGRHIQYENGTPHQIAGLPIAEQILTDCGFYPEEMKEILYAIENHRNKEMLKRNDLAGILYRADKLADFNEVFTKGKADAALAAVPKKSATGARKRKIWRYSTEAEYTKRGKADEDRKQRI